MDMQKKISAMKARQNLGQIMNEVSIRGDDYIIERAGKPLVAIIDMEKYQRLEEERQEALHAVRSIWSKMEGADPREVEEIIEEAMRATRKRKATPKL
jgi:prevent-host-death family protein